MVKAKKMKSGRWRASIYLGKNEYGKKEYKDIYGLSEKECNERVIDFLYKKNNNLIDNTKISKTALVTFEEYYDDWLSNRLDLSNRTISEYKSVKNKHLTPLLKVELKKIDNKMLKFYYKNLSEKESSTLVHRVSSYLNCFLRAMQNDDRVSIDPYLFKGIKLPKKNKFKPYFIKENEYKKIIELLKNKYENNTTDYYLYILIILCSCGLRISEALAININDIDFNKNTIKINKEQTFIKGIGFCIVEDTKTSSSDRIIVVPKNIIPILKKHIAKIKIIKQKNDLLNLNIDYSYIYIDKNGIKHTLPGYELIISNLKLQMVPKNTADRSWKNFREMNGYGSMRVHDMRRYAATFFRDNGVPLEVAKLQLGHSDTAMTRYYENTDIDSMKQYLDNLNL